MNRWLHFGLHPLRTARNVAYRMPKTVSDRRHVFIVGVPRSGTTLMKTILVAHPEIGGSVWESTGIFGIRDIFDYGMGEVEPAQMQQLLANSTDLIAFYDSIADCLLAQKAAQVFVDKLQVRALRLAYVQRYFPKSVFLHVVRDGRDCYCSARLHPNVPQSHSLTGFARYWTRSVAVPAKAIAPDRLFTVRYEDLTADPESAMADLMGFLGLTFQREQIDVQHYGAITRMKHRKVHENLGKPISDRSQGRWRRELSDEDNGTFCRIAGVALRRFGYDAGTPDVSTRAVGAGART